MSDPKNPLENLTLQAWDLERLKPAPNNNKNHTPEDIRKLAKSLAEMGQITPVVVDKNGEIIAGHGRHAAAQLLGWKQIKVYQLPVDRATAIKMRLADNLTANQKYNQQNILAELSELKDLGDFDIDLDLDAIMPDQKLQGVIKTHFNLEDELRDNAGLSDDVLADVREFSDENDRLMEAADEAEKSIKNGFGFDKFSAAEIRRVKRFMALVLEETGETDARQGFLKWIEQVMA